MIAIKINQSIPEEIKNVVRETAIACIDKFENYRKLDMSGISNGSCCAAVKLTNGDYRFGNSRGFDDFETIKVGARSINHAEVHLLKHIDDESFEPFIYVDLIPCPNCTIFLDGDIQNENGEIGFTAYYQFESATEMANVHALPKEQQIAFLCELMENKPIYYCVKPEEATAPANLISIPQFFGLLKPENKTPKTPYKFGTYAEQNVQNLNNLKQGTYYAGGSRQQNFKIIPKATCSAIMVYDRSSGTYCFYHKCQGVPSEAFRNAIAGVQPDNLFVLYVTPPAEDKLNFQDHGYLKDIQWFRNQSIPYSHIAWVHGKCKGLVITPQDQFAII